MTPKRLPSPELVRRHLNYNPDTGQLTWRLPRQKRVVGNVAGSLWPNGYIYIGIDYTDVAAHWVAWAHHYGSWPSKRLDHINGNRTDNRISNLREATAAENSQNMVRRSRGTGHRLGVSWCKDRCKWSAGIWLDGKSYFLGRFDTQEGAAAAYAAAKRKMHTFNPEVPVR